MGQRRAALLALHKAPPIRSLIIQASLQRMHRDVVLKPGSEAPNEGSSEALCFTTDQRVEAAEWKNRQCSRWHLPFRCRFSLGGSGTIITQRRAEWGVLINGLRMLSDKDSSYRSYTQAAGGD